MHWSVIIKVESDNLFYISKYAEPENYSYSLRVCYCAFFSNK